MKKVFAGYCLLFCSNLGFTQVESTIPFRISSVPGYAEVRVFSNIDLKRMVADSMSDSTVDGIDVNGNGVRDDLDKLVNVVTLDGNLRGALTDVLSIYQSLMMFPPQTEFDKEDSFAMIGDGMECVIGLTGGLGGPARYITDVIETALYNNRDRQAASKELSRIFEGIEYTSSDSLDINCLRASEGANYQRARIAKSTIKHRDLSVIPIRSDLIIDENKIDSNNNRLINNIMLDRAKDTQHRAQNESEISPVIHTSYAEAPQASRVLPQEISVESKGIREAGGWQLTPGPMDETTYIANDRIKNNY